MTASRSTAIVNLCFHGIGSPGRELEPGESEYWISEPTFHEILDLVVDRDDVRLSFDDGNASDTAVALPALIDRGLTAEFFVIAGRLDEDGSLSSDDVRGLVGAKMSVGSHGWHHRSWREAAGERRHDEFVRARSRLEEASGRKVTTAACPLGLYDRRVLRDLGRLGYKKVMTSDRAEARADGWLQPRFSVRRGDDAAAVAAWLAPSGHAARLRSQARMTVKRLR